MHFRNYFTYFLFGLICVSLLTSNANAAITIESVSGASVIDKESSSSIKIYGGIAGTDSAGDCASKDTVNTCNNCNSGSLLACNENRIYDTLTLTIQLKSSTVSGEIKLLKSTSIVATGETTTTTNQTKSISVNWSAICSNTTGADASCSTNETSATAFTVGIDSDDDGDLDDSAGVSVYINTPGSANTIDYCDGSQGEGICSYEIFPGDKKVYFLDPESDESTFPVTTYGLSITSVRVYLSTDSFANATPTNADLIADLDGDVDDDDNFYVTKRTITGTEIENDSFYFSRIGVVDTAGNVSFLTSDANIDAAGTCDSTWTSSSVISDTDDDGCPYVAKPGVVVGLLSEDVNCFIATAAYGNFWNNKVKDLRNFRDKYLKTTKWGQNFVDFYYEHSPRLARWIHNRPAAQPFVRILLWPAWALATISLKWGLAWMLITVFATLLIPFAVYRYWLRSRLLLKAQ
jgi:hypothetical protein